MSLEVEMSTDMNSLPQTNESDAVDQNELVDKILAEMNNKTSPPSDDVSHENTSNSITEIAPPGEYSPSPSNESSSFVNHPINDISSKTENLAEVTTRYTPDIVNLPYRIIIYSTLLSIFLFLVFTSQVSSNILQQIPYMFYEGSRTVLGGLLTIGLFGFVTLIGNYYIHVLN